jgi:hypothetical protein
MKTYKELREELVTGNTDTNVGELNEVSLKTFGGVVLFSKVQKLMKEIQGVKTSAADNVDEKLDKLFLKMDLLSKQNMVTSLLVTQLGVMTKRGKVK